MQMDMMCLWYLKLSLSSHIKRQHRVTSNDRDILRQIHRYCTHAQIICRIKNHVQTAVKTNVTQNRVVLKKNTCESVRPKNAFVSTVAAVAATTVTIKLDCLIWSPPKLDDSLIRNAKFVKNSLSLLKNIF